MQTLDEVIEIVQSANKIQLLKEKVKPIFEHMTYSKKEKNQIVSQIGDINRNLNVLISGILRLYYIDANGNDITRFFGTKGNISIGLGERQPYVVEALEDCEFFSVDWKKIKRLASEDIYWIKIWNQLLQKSIGYKIYRESSFLTESATERYIDFKRMYPELEKQVNQAYIASYLGITPVSLSRIRRTIKEKR